MGHTFVIPKAAGISHVEENAAAGSLQLNDADLKRIDAAFPARQAAPRAADDLIGRATAADPALAPMGKAG